MGCEGQVVEQLADEVVVICLVQAHALGILIGRLGTLDRDALDRRLSQLAVVAVGPAPAGPRGRDFAAARPNALWVADLTYLACWEGRLFFAFVLDVFSRIVAGWQLATHMRTDLVLDALGTALALRGPGADVGLVHHSDAGSQGGLSRSSQQVLFAGL